MSFTILSELNRLDTGRESGVEGVGVEWESADLAVQKDW